MSRAGAHARVLAATAVAVAAAPFVACALDFDRYAPLDSESGAPPIELPLGPADVASNDVGAESSRADARVDVSSGEAATPCSAPAMCFQQATSCGAACRQNYQRCSRQCGDADTQCLTPCTNAQQSCLGRCATSCIGCAQDAGCPSSNNCLAATNG